MEKRGALFNNGLTHFLGKKVCSPFGFRDTGLNNYWNIKFPHNCEKLKENNVGTIEVDSIFV